MFYYFFLFVSLCIALTRCENGAVDQNAQCKYDNNGTDTVLSVGRFCIHKDQKIYKSADGACQPQPAGTYLFKANGNFYDSITLDSSYTGNDAGLIYECTSVPVCKQVISSSVVISSKYMYTCNGDGLCIKATTFNSGYYLVGPPTVVTAEQYLSYGKMLKCLNSNFDACTEVTMGSLSGGENFIDAVSSGNIITCVSSSSCYSSSHGGSFGETTYYVNGEDSLQIIACSNTGCLSSPGSQLQGHAYISGTDPEKKKLITFDGTAFEVDGSQIEADSYYIDGTNPMNLISCTTSGGCFVGTPPIASGSSMLFKVDATDTEGDHTIIPVMVVFLQKVN